MPGEPLSPKDVPMPKPDAVGPDMEIPSGPGPSMPVIKKKKTLPLKIEV